MATATATANTKEPVYLDADDEIRGQKYVCLSFLTPNRGLLREKQHFFTSEFLKFYAMDYKIRATESFMSEQFRWLQQVLSDVELGLQNADVSAETAAVTRKLAAELSHKRGELSRKSAADLEAHVKDNLNQFKESDIIESYAKYMVVNRQRLEDEFHKQKDFQTTMHGLKVRGCYSTHEEAVMRAKRLNKNDPNFNVFVADVGQWLPWDPSPDDIEEQSYPEGTVAGDALNELMKAYKKNAAESKELFEKDKDEAVAKALQETEALKAKVLTMSGRGSGGVSESKSNDGDMFDGIADLAIQRRLERAATAAASSNNPTGRELRQQERDAASTKLTAKELRLQEEAAASAAAPVVQEVSPDFNIGRIILDDCTSEGLERARELRQQERDAASAPAPEEDSTPAE